MNSPTLDIISAYLDEVEYCYRSEEANHLARTKQRDRSCKYELEVELVLSLRLCASVRDFN